MLFSVSLNNSIEKCLEGDKEIIRTHWAQMVGTFTSLS